MALSSGSSPTTMSEARSAFSLPLYAALQGLIVLGYALRPSWYRPLLFIPIVVISCYLIFFTTAGPIADVGLGGVIPTQMLYALDGLVFKDVQETLCRVGEKPGQIVSAPFFKRLAWGWHLHNSPRGVQWTHELSHIPKNSPGLNGPHCRKAFILSRITTICICAAIQAAFTIINAANPALVPGATPLVHQTLYIRTLSHVGLGIPAVAQINSLHCLASVVLVGTGVSQPADWPPLFGSAANMYTVQNFWRLVWHQMLRRPILSAANFLLHPVLRFPQLSPRTALSKSSVIVGLLKLHTAFFISALIHFSSEYMMLGRDGTGAFSFFVLQPWIITLEIAVRYLVTGSIYANGKPLSLVWRFLGYIWVCSWFIAVVPLIQQPMVDAGIFVGPSGLKLTQNVARWLALDVI